MTDSDEITDLVSLAVTTMTQTSGKKDTTLDPENQPATANGNDTQVMVVEPGVQPLEPNLRRNIVGFFWGVLASLFFAISTSCTQV